MLTLVRFALGFTLVFTALFLIFLVLIQRGRGGGLAGAFGGMGGQSAFGTKAGDVFTKITVGVAAFWILLCVLSINVLGRQQSLLSGTLGSASPEAMGPSAGALPGAQPGSIPATQQSAPPATPPATDAAPPAAAPAAAAPAASAPAADAPSAPPAAAEPAAAK
jgi:preprotein translocase subunit SecG